MWGGLFSPQPGFGPAPRGASTHDAAEKEAHSQGTPVLLKLCFFACRRDSTLLRAAGQKAGCSPEGLPHKTPVVHRLRRSRACATWSETVDGDVFSQLFL